MKYSGYYNYNGVFISNLSFQLRPILCGLNVGFYEFFKLVKSESYRINLTNEFSSSSLSVIKLCTILKWLLNN